MSIPISEGRCQSVGEFRLTLAHSGTNDYRRTGADTWVTQAGGLAGSPVWARHQAARNLQPA